MNINIVYVDDFGAIGDGKTPCTNAIVKAINYATKFEGKVYIVFKKGTYLLSKPDKYTKTSIGSSYLFSCEYGDNISIEGNETELIIEDSFCGLFLFKHCKNISISGFTIKHSMVPWVECEVKEINHAAKTFDIDVLNDSSILDDDRLSGKLSLGFLRDRDNPRLMNKDFYDFFGRVKEYKKISDTIYRMHINDERGLLKDKLKKGDKIIFNNRPYGGHILETFKCENICFCNCNIHSSSGGVYVASYTTGRILINKINVLFENDERWLTTNADAFHFQHGTHSVEITDCVVEGINDDIINFYQVDLSVTKVLAENKIEITNIDANWLPQKGEKIIIFNNDIGIIKAVANVFEICEIEENRRCVVILDRNIKDLNSDGDRMERDAVFSCNAMFDSVLIKNNIFRSSRRYGMLLRCANACVTQNKIYDLGGSALYSYSDGKYYNEGLGLYNLFFCDNFVSNTAYVEEHGQREFGAAVCIRTDMTSENGERCFSNSVVHTNLFIENNIIKYTSKNGIVIACAQNVVVKNNKISKDYDDLSKRNIVTTNVLNCVVENDE